LGFVSAQWINTVLSPKRNGLETGRLNLAMDGATSGNRKRGAEPPPRKTKWFEERPDNISFGLRRRGLPAATQRQVELNDGE
jgi:hypothetical protein